MEPDNKPIMSANEVAAFLGVCPHTIRAYAKTGIIPAAKMGRLWRFKREDLVEFIRKQYKGPDAAAQL